MKDAHTASRNVEIALSVGKHWIDIYRAAYGLNMPPKSLGEALTIRDEQDPCERAHKWIVEQRMREAPPIRVFRTEAIFGPQLAQEYPGPVSTGCACDPVAVVNQAAVDKLTEIEARGGKVAKRLEKDGK